VHKLVVIDLTCADISLFEEYERKAIPLLSRYGGRLELGLRSTDSMTETHILYFPDDASFESFLADPLRAQLQDEWKRSGATTTVASVASIDYL